MGLLSLVLIASGPVAALAMAADGDPVAVDVPVSTETTTTTPTETTPTETIPTETTPTETTPTETIPTETTPTETIPTETIPTETTPTETTPPAEPQPTQPQPASQPQPSGSRFDSSPAPATTRDEPSASGAPSASAAWTMRTISPVVRLAGTLSRRGVRISVLSVRVSAKASEIIIRCRGRGCPSGVQRRVANRGLVRFTRFNRSLAAGAVIEILIRKDGAIGKYTRFTIRRGTAPKRIDSCLKPGANRPSRCPQS